VLEATEHVWNRACLEHLKRVRLEQSAFGSERVKTRETHLGKLDFPVLFSVSVYSLW
jgi:hypothetical protein